MNFQSGFTVTDTGTKIQIEPDGSFVRTTGAQTVAGAKTFTDAATFSGTITGPTAATFTIDSGGANAINIGGTTATTLNLGRAGQTQALLGNGSVAGTLTVTGAATLSSSLAVSGATTLSGTLAVTGDSTLGNTTLSSGKTLTVGGPSNTISTQVATLINTGGGLTSGQALHVSTDTSAFSTGNTQDSLNATRGFFYGGLADSSRGATSFVSAGNFTGTLVALTADQTTAGTILGISGKNLTTGKAIDVSLGTLYSSTTDTVAGYTVGAVNVRAQSFTGNIFNVSAQGAGGASANLANFKSTQLAGQVLNVDAQSLTTGKAVAVTLGTGGTGFYLNTAAGYSGNLASLNVNGAPKLSIDQAGNTTLGGTLTVQGASVTGPASAAFSIDNGNASAINIGGTTATTVNIGRATQTQALLGNATVAGTLGVSGATTLSSTLGVSGNATFAGTITGPAAATFTVDSGGANAIAIGGTNATTVNIGRTGQTQALLGNATVAGTLGVSGATTLSSTLAVTGNVTFGGTISGPTAASFSIDSGGANILSLGGTNATTINIGRTGQTQALLGNATVAGTLTVTAQTNANGNLQIGSSGAPITAHHSASATLDFGLIGMDACANLTVTVTGAVVGDSVVATPTPVAGGIETLVGNRKAWVSAANTVTIRFCSQDGIGDPSVQTWRVDVWRH